MSSLYFESPTEEQKERLQAEQAAALKRRLEELVWSTADDVGNPTGCYRMKDYSDQEMAAYVEGIRLVVEIMAERSEVEVRNTRQLAAAIGERLRRRQSPRQKLATRRLNNLIEAIRDKRIAMLDQYEELHYKTEFRVWQDKVWKLQRGELHSKEEDADLVIVQRELTALMDLRSELINQKHWRDESWKRRQAKTEAAAA